MRRCTRCSNDVVDEHGHPRYDTFFCSDPCRREDRREKMAAKRARDRRETDRRVRVELRRRGIEYEEARQ